MAEHDDDAPLSAEEVLQYGPCVESQVWTPVWIQEARAPIAVAAGKPKLGKVFDENGVGKMAVIRPCVSRGRRVRGLSPIYTPQMLEASAGVFKGWPQFADHCPPALAATMAKHGRSVKELGGQILSSWWQRDHVHEDDAQYGYQKGAVLAEAWATPLIRNLVGENPNLLHTSINAWPTSGKPGPVPWAPRVKGMLIEGIRRQPQGSVDYVVRGGAGGRLLLIEGAENDEPGWPEVGEWDEESTRFVVSLAESFYASRHMPDLTLPTKPDELAAWLQEHAPHLVPALAESSEEKPTPPAAVAPPAGVAGLTEQQVRDLIAESSSGQPSAEEFEERLRESTEQLVAEREMLRTRSERALELVRLAEGIPETWKADIAARYRLSAESTPAPLLIESADLTDAEGKPLSEDQVLEQRVKDELQHVRGLLAEARGKPRPSGEGAAKPSAESGRRSSKPEIPYWRQSFAEMGIAESEEKALDIYGEKVEA